MMKYFLGKPAYFVIWIGVIASIFFMIMQSDKDYKHNIFLLEKNLYDEAESHFNNMLITRSWNALHGGVYVKQKEGLKPNPYLKDSILIYDNNKTLIKINPAWMTRQISELTNKKSKYFYKITSLRPLNPSNQPDKFEREALNFFEKNNNQSYYSRFGTDNGAVNRFNFMGKLNVKKECMSCHAYQGYKIGDIRGGISVSLPTNNFNVATSYLKEKLVSDKIIIVVLNIIIGLLLTLYIRKLTTHQDILSSLNDELEIKVADRTKALDKLNLKLKDRVKEEVQTNIQNEEVMIAQSRNAAMGEMINMLAHQWRQPIAIIEMGVNNILIDMELGDINNEVFKSELQDIAANTQKLSLTITNFSGYFKEAVEAKDTKPIVVLENVINIMKSSLEHNGVTIEIDDSSDNTICIHQEKLFQVFLTLITNAKEILVERNIENKVINIAIEEDSEYVITKICDAAGGITSDHIEQVFEPYFSTKNGAEGVGLGLYLSKIIVEKQLNGKLTVNNETDGACFTVWIPK